ncbi:hypothetical protein CHS0354_007665 [Potamilus streckersoni]|uniref:Uncharacterized protein n=1 Tax=Potamilus streckersoni TaxID=2493646 RepID=A0AAE0SHI6_9BIVA|nr:hypothetical protein CHS0354_007665 [Potamilus streckersoni]
MKGKQIGTDSPPQKKIALVRLDLISGWVLGLGPCGTNCSRASINSNTRYTREEVLREQGDRFFFGNWTVEAKMNGIRHSESMLINHEVYSHLTESVLDVSEKARWEQDWMVVHYPMIPGTAYMDIM